MWTPECNIAIFPIIPVTSQGLLLVGVLENNLVDSPIGATLVLLRVFDFCCIDKHIYHWRRVS